MFWVCFWGKSRGKVGPAGFKSEREVQSRIAQSRGQGPRGEPAACGLADNGVNPIVLKTLFPVQFWYNFFL